MTRPYVATIKTEQLAKNLADFIVSPEGQKVFREALERATETANELQEARRVDPRSLLEPFTL